MLLIDWLPEVAFVPVQPPEAVHDVALALDHVSIELPPGMTVVGLALSVSVGAAVALTVTCALREMLPPEPVHCRV